MISDDMALVREYAQSNSEQAFATLVSRHVNLIYSVALRQVHDPPLAEEIAQAVFIILSREAKSLSPKTILSGWLCRTARYISADTLKSQRRRQFREQEAHMQSLLNEPEPGVWNQIAPLLDEALNCLGEKEHDAVVLRFFDGKELKQVGAAMGTTEDAARMRVNRGVEKLREFFTKRGVTLSATAIAGAVAANSVQAAPAGLAVTITAAALSGTTITTAAVIAATKIIAMTTLQKTFFTAALAVVAGAGIYEAHQALRLRDQNQALQQKQLPLAEQIQQLQRERDAATNRLASVIAENENMKSVQNTMELLKQRGEVGRLRQELQGLPAARAALLKQKLEEMPDKKIPELKFLTEKDWNNAAWNADLQTDDGIRLALSKLRDEAVDTFLNLTRTALKKYLAAHNNMLPSDLLPLKSYFDTPVTDEMLQRYAFMQTGELSSNLTQSVVRKAVDADADYDSNQEMSMSGAGGGSFNRIHDAIYNATMAFIVDNNGQAPSDPSQITSYLGRSIDAASLQKNFGQITNDIAANPPSPRSIAIAQVKRAYAAAHNGMSPRNPLDLLPYITTPEQHAAFQQLDQNVPAAK